MMKKQKKQQKQQRLQEDQTQTTHEPRRSQWRKNDKGFKKINPKQQRSNPNCEDQTQTMKIVSKQRKWNHEDKGDWT